ncbi:hypothetical protein I3842_16G029500 [Carya illinoinensis]|uniref:Legumain prodomain domain-containing protein n=1 Tax=Carya illinoinensis TaxID=32201 RepID=A0A922D414_CARIL|nr:hypothetical protein I3842_16G029500 [Carya illinoinensis]
MNRIVVVLLFLGLYAYSSASAGRDLPGDHLRLPSEASRFFGRVGGAVDDKEDDSSGIRWAVLIAGSNGYWNYRHQADICHAYQLLRQGGLKDENIVVFMYDDIAFNEENPRPGVIINKPDGHDVYNGVPKDYTGDDVTVDNFFAVLLGNRTAITGGSGKVVDSGPNDHIFVYYSDHGGPGVLGMPTNPFLYAEDLIEVLKKKHASGTYKSLVFYLEACESGSIFEGLLPEGSPRKVEAQKQFVEAMSHRMHVDESVKLIGKLLFGIEKGPKVLNNVRPAGQTLVDDWGCLKTLVRTFETHCGSLSQYGMKHMRAFANICNAGILKEQMADASAQACVSFPSGPWSSLHKGFSA